MSVTDTGAAATSARTVDVDLGDPIPTIASDGYDAVHVVARIHARPVARLLLPLEHGGIGAAELARRIWEAASPAVRTHLREDGLATPERLGPDGLGAVEVTATPCARRRAVTLAEPPDVTVVVATRDRTETLMRCLRSIAEQDYPGRFELVVVDNAPSSDATARALRALDGRLDGVPIHYVHEPTPGLALAHRRGLEAATGTWMAITDDDVLADPQWLSALAEAAVGEPGVGAVTGLILPAELETPAQLLLEQQGGFDRGFVPRVVDTGRRRPAEPLFPVATGRLGSGANMAFDVALLRSLDAIDPALGAGTPARGGDDLAMLLRVLRSGRAVAYQPGALVWHWHRRDYDLLRRQAGHYGAGLGAYLTSAVRHDPALLLTMARGLPHAVRHVLDPRSVKNAQKSTTYPRELDRAERLGMLRGPFGYAASAWRHRRTGPTAGPTRDAEVPA